LIADEQNLNRLLFSVFSKEQATRKNIFFHIASSLVTVVIQLSMDPADI